MAIPMYCALVLDGERCVAFWNCLNIARQSCQIWPYRSERLSTDPFKRSNETIKCVARSRSEVLLCAVDFRTFIWSLGKCSAANIFESLLVLLHSVIPLLNNSCSVLALPFKTTSKGACMVGILPALLDYVLARWWSQVSWQAKCVVCRIKKLLCCAADEPVDTRCAVSTKWPGSAVVAGISGKPSACSEQ